LPDQGKSTDAENASEISRQAGRDDPVRGGANESGLPDYLLTEAEACTDPRRKAEALFEAALARQGKNDSSRELAPLLTQSLLADPSYQPTTWALRTLTRARGQWENLLRVLEAEGRFAALPSAGDRADIMTEHGRISAQHLGREEAAREDHERAVKTDPDNLAARLSGLSLTLQTHDWDGARAWLEQLISRLDPHPETGALTVVLARLEARAGAPALQPDEMVAPLLRAASRGLTAGGVGAELDRLSLLSGSAKTRLTVLEAFTAGVSRLDSKHAAATPFVLAMLREKARLLVTLGHSQRALEAIQTAARLFPDSALVAADLQDVAVVAGHADLSGGASEGGEFEGEPVARVGGADRAESALWAAEAALGAGDTTAATMALGQVETDSGLFPMAALMGAYLAARTGDPEALEAWCSGLAQALSIADAEDRAQADGASGNTAREATARARRESAHWWVRAGAVKELGLNDSAAALAHYERALQTAPDYRPAVEGLASVYTRQERWADLACLLNEQGSSVSSADEQLGVQQTLLLLSRDVLKDWPAARAAAEFVAGHKPELGALWAWVDAAACALLAEARAPGKGDRTAGESDGPGALELQGAMQAFWDRCADPGRAVVADAVAQVFFACGFVDAGTLWAQRALALDPTASILGDLEARAIGGESRAALKKLLAAEVAALETHQPSETHAAQLRAARFHLACACAVAEPELAIETLKPLRDEGNAVAWRWSLMWIRDVKRPHFLSALAQEASAPLRVSEAVDSEGSLVDPDTRAVQTTDQQFLELLHAEALEGTLLEPGEQPAATREALKRYRVLADSAHRSGDKRMAIAARFGQLRCADRLQDADGAAAAFMGLSEVVGADQSAAFGQTSWRLSLSNRLVGASDATFCEPVSPFDRWLSALETGDRQAALVALDSWAAELTSGEGRGGESDSGRAALAAALSWRAAVVRRLSGEGEATEALEALSRARTAGIRMNSDVALTDLFEPGPGADRGGVLVGAWQVRAGRLAASTGKAGRDLAYACWLDAAEQSFLDGAAGPARAFCLAALDVRRDALEPVEILRRIARLTGRRRDEARCAERIGDLLTHPDNAAREYAAAALAFDDLGATDEAVRAFAKVLDRSPDDDEAFARIVSILGSRSRWADLEHILGFKLTRLRLALQARPQAASGPHADLARSLATLYERRAHVRIHRLNRTGAGIDDYKRAIAQKSDHFPALLGLGHQALSASAYNQAALLLAAAQEAIPDDYPPNAAARLSRELGEALVGSGRTDAAINALAKSLSLVPSDVPTVRMFVDLCVAEGYPERVIEVLVPLAERLEDQRDRAFLHTRVGLVAWRHLDDSEQALSEFALALEADPFSESGAHIASLVNSGTDLGAAADSVAKAARVLGTGLADGETRSRTLESFIPLAHAQKHSACAFFAEQVLSVSEDVGARPVPPLSAPRMLPAGLLYGVGDAEAIKDDEDSNRALRTWLGCWAAVAPALERHFASGDRPRPRNRSRSATDERLAWIESTAAALGFLEIHVHVVDDDGPVVAYAHPRPVVLVPQARFTGDASARFAIARALVQLRLGTHLLDAKAMGEQCLEPGQLPQIWASVASLCGADIEIADGHERVSADKDIVKSLARALGRSEVKGLSVYADELVPPIDIEAWISCCEKIVSRAALAFSGDLVTALESITEGSFGIQHLSKLPNALGLLEFSLSPAMQNLADGAGIAYPPYDPQPGAADELAEPGNSEPEGEP